MFTYLTFIALALAGPCKKHLVQMSVEQSLHTKLQVSPKSKKLNLPIEFSNKVIQLLRKTDWESTPVTTTIKRVATKCLQEIGRAEVASDANPCALLVQVIQKWHEENWKPDEGTPKWERFGGQGQTSALTYKILNEYEFSQWLKKRGDFARYDHVAAYVSLDLINRTQNSISDFVTDLNGQKIPFGTLVEIMRRDGFDPTGAPDLVPVSNGRFATFDHRRLTAAKWARNIDKVLSKVHRPEAAVPSEIFSKSMSVNVKTQQPISIPDFRKGGFHMVEMGYRPKNWGESVYCACANTRYKDSPNFPFEGAAGLPSPPPSYFHR
jgi:hypothetical protein